MKLNTMLVLAVAAATACTGCNTMRGAGKDIEKGGEKIQDAVSQVQQEHHIQTRQGQPAKGETIHHARHGRNAHQS